MIEGSRLSLGETKETVPAAADSRPVPAGESSAVEALSAPESPADTIAICREIAAGPLPWEMSKEQFMAAAGRGRRGQDIYPDEWQSFLEGKKPLLLGSGSSDDERLNEDPALAHIGEGGRRAYYLKSLATERVPNLRLWEAATVMSTGKYKQVWDFLQALALGYTVDDFCGLMVRTGVSYEEVVADAIARGFRPLELPQPVQGLEEGFAYLPEHLQQAVMIVRKNVPQLGRGLSVYFGGTSWMGLEDLRKLADYLQETVHAFSDNPDKHYFITRRFGSKPILLSQNGNMRLAE